MTAPLVTPTESLWNDIDSYLVAKAISDLGTGSAYTTLKVLEVHVDDTLEPQEDWHLPAIVISSFLCELDTTLGGDAFDSAVNKYRCGITAVLSATSYDQARKDTKEMIRRIAKLARALGAMGRMASTDGETVIDSRIAMQQARIYPAKGSETVWYGAGIVGVDVFAEVEQ